MTHSIHNESFVFETQVMEWCTLPMGAVSLNAVTFEAHSSEWHGYDHLDEVFLGCIIAHQDNKMGLVVWLPTEKGELEISTVSRPELLAQSNLVYARVLDEEKKSLLSRWLGLAYNLACQWLEVNSHSHDDSATAQSISALLRGCTIRNSRLREQSAEMCAEESTLLDEDNVQSGCDLSSSDDEAHHGSAAAETVRSRAPQSKAATKRPKQITSFIKGAAHRHELHSKPGTWSFAVVEPGPRSIAQPTTDTSMTGASLISPRNHVFSMEDLIRKFLCCKITVVGLGIPLARGSTSRLEISFLDWLSELADECRDLFALGVG